MWVRVAFLLVLELCGLILFLFGVFKQSVPVIVVGAVMYVAFSRLFNSYALRVERTYRERFGDEAQTKENKNAEA